MDFSELKESRGLCKKCHGTGVISRLTDDGVLLEDCECIKRVSNIINLKKANIPSQYWEYSLKDLTKRFIEKNADQLKKVHSYIDTITKNIRNGRGIWFNAAPGLGKSIIIRSILQEAMDKNFRAYFERASHIVNLKFKSLNDSGAYELMDHIIQDVDILAIEEIEKVYLSDDGAMNNQLFYEFLSDIYDSRKAILISSNQKQSEVLRRFPNYIGDRLKSLANITFVGISERCQGSVQTK